ncbi:MAG: cellulose synthase/poly-beta-1,6-N-acetylglucosamine synthase-like glycosyltransferase [Bacteriovoracaceae bacterium]|jgi:cellulose synthase/poly-beta-1,6-N-acetylglucosamine synthase-like glycosyltransferase
MSLTIIAALILGLIFYTYFGYMILVLILGKIRNKKVIKKDIRPRVALMIAAYNEEAGIKDKIENSLELTYPKELLRIIVVSDGSTDKTDEITASYSDKGVELIRVEGRVGKTEARNVAVSQVEEEIIVFSDGTTVFEANAIEMLIRNFADPEVGMVSGHLKYQDKGETKMGAGQTLYWKYECAIKRAQTYMGTLTGSLGCMTAFRRAYYTSLPANIIEDFTEPLMFVQKGFRVVFEEEAVCYEETTTKTQSEWHMRVRVIRGGMTGMLFAKKILNPFKFPVPALQLISHKVLRWLIPVFGCLLFLVTCLGISNDSSNVFLGMLFILQLGFYLTALMALVFEQLGIHNKILGIPLYFIVVNSAALMALMKTLTSSLEATWETKR